MRAALLVIALVACGDHRTTTLLHVLPDPVSFELATDVITAINDAATLRLIEIGAEPGATVYVVYDGVCGSYSSAKREIRFGECSGLPGSDAIVLVHELGHAFGLSHSTDPNSIMWPVIRIRERDEAIASLLKELGL